MKKRAFNNVCEFFRAEHTPLEMGLLVTAAALGGVVLGIACCPSRSITVGSSNGCANTFTEAPKKDKK